MKRSNKKVSVVVPCYNTSAYLDKCMEYLLKQTIGIENMEIILVDDASTDDGATWELIMKYEAEYPDTILAVHLDENMRQGGARNVGVSYAGGEYLIFCDADDWLLEEALEHCYYAAIENDADMVEFLGINVMSRDEIVKLEKGRRSGLIEIDTEEKKKAFILNTTEEISYGSQTKLYRLSMILDNHIAFVPHLIFEEPSFTVPVRLYTKRHYFLDERLYVWYLSPNSTVRSDWGEHKWDNPKVWMHLMDDLSERGFLQKYPKEFEYLFFGWGLGLSIRMLLKRGYVLTKEELNFLVNMVITLFPNVSENEYIHQGIGGKAWSDLLLALLNMEITDESAQVANEVFKNCVQV